MYKLGLEEAEEPEIQSPTSVGSQRKLLLLLLHRLCKSLCVDHNKRKILKEMEIPDHFTCLLRNLYVGQEATVTTLHGKTDWFKIGKGVWQDCILSPCLFNLYADFTMQNAGLDESQAGIKTDGRSINSLRYADNTILMPKTEEELNSFFFYKKFIYLWLCWIFVAASGFFL